MPEILRFRRRTGRSRHVLGSVDNHLEAMGTYGCMLFWAAGGRDVKIRKIYYVYKDMGMHLRKMIPKRRVKAELREDRSESLTVANFFIFSASNREQLTSLGVLTLLEDLRN